MDPIHLAITRRVKKDRTEEFERLLVEFASASLQGSGARGVHLIYPPPDSGCRDYGILRSFVDNEARNAFYDSALYRDWLARIEPLVEGEAHYETLSGLEAWFRQPDGQKPPPRWKMAVLTWIAVWPVSIAVPASLGPLLGNALPGWISAGIGAAGIVIVLTWAAMPLLVKAARPWLALKISN